MGNTLVARREITVGGIREWKLKQNKKRNCQRTRFDKIYSWNVRMKKQDHMQRDESALVGEGRGEDCVACRTCAARAIQTSFRTKHLRGKQRASSRVARLSHNPQKHQPEVLGSH